MWAGNRERALQSHLKGNVSWKRGIFNQRPGLKKKNTAESEESPEWAPVSPSPCNPASTCKSHAPPLTTSSQLRGCSPNFSPVPQLLHSHPGQIGSGSAASRAGARPPRPEAERALRGREGAVLPLEQGLGWARPRRLPERPKAAAFIPCTYCRLTDHCTGGLPYGLINTWTGFLKNITTGESILSLLRIFTTTFEKQDYKYILLHIILKCHWLRWANCISPHPVWENKQFQAWLSCGGKSSGNSGS